MFSTVLAALGLATCIALAVHMALPFRARARVDAAASRLTRGLMRQGRALADRFSRWRRDQRDSRAAALEAERVIRRARESAQQGKRVEGEWEGNVYRPKSFDQSKKH